MQRAVTIRPLLLAWSPVILNRVMRESSHLGPEACVKLAEIDFKEKRMELAKTFGVKRWSAYAPLLQFPLFVLVMETLRQMCGNGTGFLGLLAERIGMSGSQTMLLPVESSFALEGGLWFPDLLAPDPGSILPITLSTLLFYNAYTLGSISESAAGGASRPTAQNILKIFSMVFPGALLLITPNLPAAVVLYWNASALFAALSNHLLRALMPLPPSPTPYKPLVKPYMKNITG